jgi:phosphatidylserine decarboxylase
MTKKLAPCCAYRITQVQLARRDLKDFARSVSGSQYRIRASEAQLQLLGELKEDIAEQVKHRDEHLAQCAGLDSEATV